jgi:hypothetical protein
MVHSLDEADELLLICGQVGMLWGNGSAIEGDRVVVLMQNSTEPYA